MATDSQTSKVSFTIRRPSPVSRSTSSGPESDGGSSFKIPHLPRHLRESAPGSPLARSTTSSPGPAAYMHYADSSEDEEDEKIQDELVTGFDKFGVQRLNQERKRKASSLVIPPLENRDWRAVARKRKAIARYVPDSAKAQTGKHGSVGGMGVRDTVNSGPVFSGLQVRERLVSVKQENEESTVVVEDVKMEAVEETEDERALRAILSEANGTAKDEAVIDIIPTPITPVSEADAYKQDVQELPDSATIEDYARVPVSQFGAALLRGMGWKEGTAASRKPGKGLVEPYIPEARPPLLGIGAKEQEVYDDGSSKKGKKRADKKYIPVVRKEKEESRSDRRERSHSPPQRHSSSRRNSRSPSRGDDHDRKYREGRSKRDYDDYRRDSRERGRDRDYRRSESGRDRPRDRSRDSNRRKRE